ncbi:MAG: TldD/PmbA family protein [Acidobacteriota bacterium]
MRKLLFSLTLASLCVSFSSFGQTPVAQPALVKILAEELDRNFTTLKAKGQPAPYYLAYEVYETNADVVVASNGAIDRQEHGRNRYLDVTLRVGTPQFDNYRVSQGRRVRFTSATPIALEDEAASIKRSVWLATDQVYRGSSQWFLQLQADEKLRTKAGDTSDDFSVEKPQVFSGAPAEVKFDAKAWAERIRKLSAEFSKYPGALDASIWVEFRQLTQTLVTSEGTRIQHGRPFINIGITARGKASDGMDLNTYGDFQADDPAKLPSDAEILAAVKKVGSDLTGLLAAPLSDPYVGPAILSGRASGVLFHEIFGHRIEGHRQKDESEGQTFTKSINKPVLPDFLSVVFDATRKTYGNVTLNGYYQFDDEGVPAQKVTIVDKGILKTFLMSRTPVDGFPKSNGHGRRSPGNEIVPRQSNLLVESTKQVSDAQLRQQLVDEVKRQNKPYGLYFEQVTGGYTTTARAGLQAFTVMPLVVYRVYPDGRPDEMIRGVDIVGTPLASFAKITATSDRLEVFNGVCGAESGSVPVSAVSPAILVSEIEVQRKQRSEDRPPYLGRPPAQGIAAAQPAVRSVPQVGGLLPSSEEIATMPSLLGDFMQSEMHPFGYEAGR